MVKSRIEKSMKYGYIRVSTKGQAREGNSLEVQSRLLKEAGAEELYKDVYTGGKMDRPALEELTKKVKAGDTIIITKLDRFARSIGRASELITSLIDRGVRIEVLNIGILDNSSVSTLFRNMLLSFAQFERDMILERTMEGKEAAKGKPGFKEGRPKKFTRQQMDLAMELLEEHTYSQVSLMTGISKSTLIREKRIIQSTNQSPG